MKHKKQHGEFHHKHSLGQNFIEDEALLEQLADLSLATKEDCVLEVGPGFGALTKPLASRAQKVISLEIDSTLIPILTVTLEHCDNVQVICGDVMKTDLKKLVETHFPENCSLRIAANLPYYITTDVLMKFLFELPQVKSIAVMIQKEVGDKLLSVPGDDGYGPLAILCQYFCDVRRALDVPAVCFNPPPKVDSSFMVLCKHENPLYSVKEEAVFLKLIKSSFAMRRKTLINNMMASFPINRETAQKIIEENGFSAQVRAEQLSIRDFCVLSDSVFEVLR